MRSPQTTALLALALFACAEGESVADAGPKSADAELPCLSLFCDGALPPLTDLGLPDPPPPDRGPPLPDGGAPDMLDPDAPCNPGTRIGPCALCDLDGLPAMPEDDPLCPTITCGDAESYDRVTEGTEEVCYHTLRAPPAPGRCLTLGACHADASTYCGEETVEEVARLTPSACNAMQGCQGPTPPAVDGGRIGAPCNTYGLCNVEGECTTPAECAAVRISADSQYCDGAVTPTVYCQFFLDQGRTTCNAFCTQNGLRCVAAWNDNGGCALAEQVNCTDNLASFICRCG